MAFGYSRGLAIFVGSGDAGSVTSTAAIDGAFVYETSGDAFGIRFIAPVSQSSATLTVYAFLTAVTGTPDFQVEVRNGYDGAGDIDRPDAGGSNIGTGSSTVSSPSANTWLTFTVTCSLTVGDLYWVLVKNTHGTPASNHGTFAYRGALDSFTLGSTVAQSTFFATGFTSDGFATDPTINSNGPGSAVLKFGDGSLLGFPFVASSAHANNSNNRGTRFLFTEDVVVSGVQLGFAASTLSGVAIYQGGNTIVTETGDPSSIASATARTGYRFAPVTLTGGVAYDVVGTFSGNSTAGTFYTMGQAEGSVPTDVKACLPSCFVGSVDSATSSFTPDTSQLQLVSLLIDDNPASAGGGAGSTYKMWNH